MCCSLTSQFALWAWNNWWNWKFSLHPSSVLISFQSDVQGLWSFRPELKHNQHQWGSTGHVDVLSGPLESNEIICVIAVFMLRPPHPCLNFLPNHSNRKSCITHSTVTNAFLCIYWSHECFFSTETFGETGASDDSSQTGCRGNLIQQRSMCVWTVSWQTDLRAMNDWIKLQNTFVRRFWIW